MSLPSIISLSITIIGRPRYIGRSLWPRLPYYHPFSSTQVTQMTCSPSLLITWSSNNWDMLKCGWIIAFKRQLAFFLSSSAVLGQSRRTTTRCEVHPDLNSKNHLTANIWSNLESTTMWLTLDSNFEFSPFRLFRSLSTFSSLAFSICNSVVAIFSCSSVRCTFNSGVTLTNSRHQGHSRTFRKARTLRWMHLTASSYEQEW